MRARSSSSGSTFVVVTLALSSSGVRFVFAIGSASSSATILSIQLDGRFRPTSIGHMIISENEYSGQFFLLTRGYSDTKILKVLELNGD